ncbi:MAG: hypothetical protein SGJ18_02345 [Pseudomonadota bacterium]|nr:hypothetical protein [Pseudomonadota bacterium]
MKLYLVHCGYYDNEVGDGIYESHMNYFVCAESFGDARLKAKQIPEFHAKRMHVDGLQEIHAVDGFRLRLENDASLNKQTHITNFNHRDLAPKPAIKSTPEQEHI